MLLPDTSPSNLTPQTSNLMQRYDIQQTYDWNYQQAPDPPSKIELPAVAGSWQFAGRDVDSPLGMAAGPLLNGKWCLYYAALGFDVVTYKTVRSRDWPCYELPNLQPVVCKTLQGDEEEVAASQRFAGSWAVSFGMPSRRPEIWQQDVQRTRTQLPERQILNVSVVGTVQADWTTERLGEDYAECAATALAAGADSVELNFSCPNVSTCDGQLFQNPAASAQIAHIVRQRIGEAPMLVKVGFLSDSTALHSLIDHLSPWVDGLVMTNSVPTRVRGGEGLMFDGQLRGICGAATIDASVHQVLRAAEYRSQHGFDLELVGVGGIGSAADVRRYLDAGATAVQLATAPMVDPEVGLKIRREMGG